jgi:hypothetical protein
VTPLLEGVLSRVTGRKNEPRTQTAPVARGERLTANEELVQIHETN